MSLDELLLLEYGVVMDMMTEMANDDCKWTPLATQEDFDAFARG